MNLTVCGVNSGRDIMSMCNATHGNLQPSSSNAQFKTNRVVSISHRFCWKLLIKSLLPQVLSYCSRFDCRWLDPLALGFPKKRCPFSDSTPGSHHPLSNDDELTHLEMQLGPHARLLAKTSEARCFLQWWGRTCTERCGWLEVILFNG